MSAFWIGMIESPAAMEALFVHQNFGSPTVCFSLRHATLLACFPVNLTNF
jgi:hypothetical protein